MKRPGRVRDPLAEEPGETSGGARRKQGWLIRCGCTPGRSAHRGRATEALVWERTLASSPIPPIPNRRARLIREHGGRLVRPPARVTPPRPHHRIIPPVPVFNESIAAVAVVPPKHEAPNSGVFCGLFL